MAVADGKVHADGSGGGARARREPFWVAPLILAVGVAFVVVAFLMGRSELRYGQEGRQTQATIVRLWVDEADDDEGSDTYHVGYEFFEPVTAGTYRGSGEVGLFRYSSMRIGDSIEVSHIASQPSENRLGTPEPQLLLPIAIGAFGGLAVVFSPLMIASWILVGRTRGTGALAEGAAADGERVDVFTRSLFRAVGGPAAILAGVAFLLLAVFGVSQAANMPSLLMLALFGTVIGVALIAGGITALRRGLGTRLAEVGPDGLWLLGLGRVAWDDLAEVRIEETRRSRTSEEDHAAPAPATPQPTRLGVVPRDQALWARRPDRLSRTLGRAFFGVLNTIRPEVRLVTQSDQSPFGVAVQELDQEFEELVASVRRFVPIHSRVMEAMGTSQERPAQSPPPREPIESLSDAELLDIDARLAARRERGTTFVDEG